MKIARLFSALGFAALASLVLSPVAAANYPEKPVRLVVPNPPGGTTDILGRLIADQLSKELNQTFVVENRAGAGGAIAAQNVMAAAPDGYTLIMGNINSHMINSAIRSQLPYHPTKDFAPITIIGSTPNVLVAHPDFPAKNVQELIDLAKQKPGSLSFGSTSAGGSPHMSGELFKSMAGLEILHVPYKGASPMLTDLVGGQIPIGFDNLPSSLPLINSNKLRALAVTTTSRWEGTPDIPTMAESGLPDYEVAAWFGMFAPAGTPDEVLDALHAAIKTSLGREDVKKRLFELGAVPGGISREAFKTQIEDGIEMWTKVVDSAGLRMD
ncbi:tripartite tricarboxylate transporter substrate binding protein [Alcaligenaceae bacterium]|nr:tripartite tricarboxylate transporter substrate binding protein [Alcaligenaceae bacterium]